MSGQKHGMNRHTGGRLDGDDHLRQSIFDILFTPIGTRVMPARDYGSMLPDLVDQPLNGAIRQLMYAATAHALARWEPRFKLRKATLTVDPETPGVPILQLEGQRTDLPDPNSKIVLSIPIRTGGASTARSVN